MLQQTYLFRRRNFQILLNTHSKAFSQQQLPLLMFYAFEADGTRHLSIKLKKKNQKLPPENEDLKKSLPAKVKHGRIPQTWKPDCYIVGWGLSFCQRGLQAGSSGTWILVLATFASYWNLSQPVQNIIILEWENWIKQYIIDDFHRYALFQAVK